MFTKLASTCLLLASLAVAQSAPDSAGSGQGLLRKLEASSLGLSISGTARSDFLQAALSGDSVNRQQPSHENLDFSQADVDLIARPSSNTEGKLLFRVHQDWDNYYNEGPNPLLARWFDFDGNIAQEKIRFAVGDFLEKYSPLTIYAPEPEFLYEPEIFADRRQQAMDEWFLGGHQVPLQGLHAIYDQDVTPVLNVNAGLTGARLRSGAATAAVDWTYWNDDVAKFLGSGYAKLKAYDALEIGYTRVQVTDWVAGTRAQDNQYVLLNPTARYEDVAVNAVNAGFDANRLFKNPNLTLRADAEWAFSDYNRMRDVVDTLAVHIVSDTFYNASARKWEYLDTSYDRNLKLQTLNQFSGQALNAAVHAGYRFGNDSLFGVKVNAAYIRNDSGYVNDLAQSPTFIGNRIFNSKNNVGGFNNGYNTFDALYDYVYTVDPVTLINTSEYWYPDTKTNQQGTYGYEGTNNWYRAPDFRSSYTNTVWTKAERDSLMASLDANLQLLFPFGPATPNRNGVNLDATLFFLGNKVEATGLFASLKEMEGHRLDSVSVLGASTFGRIGGGLKIQLGALLHLPNRITLSSSYVQDSKQQPSYTHADTSFAAMDFKTSLINAGAYIGIWKHLALTAGYQHIQSNPWLGTYVSSGNAVSPQLADLTEDNWLVGVEIMLTHGAYFTADYGMMDEDETVTRSKFSQSVSSAGLRLAF